MAWRIEFDPDAFKELEKLDHEVQRRILKFLRKRIATSKDPRRLGKPLKGDKKGFWSFRVGGYRVICSIESEILLVFVVRIGHRRNVYD